MLGLASAGFVSPTLLFEGDEDKGPTLSDQLLGASLRTMRLLQGDTVQQIFQTPLNTLKEAKEYLHGLMGKTSVSAADLEQAYNKLVLDTDQKALAIARVVEIQNSVSNATQALMVGASALVKNDSDGMTKYAAALNEAIEKIQPISKYQEPVVQALAARAEEVVEFLEDIRTTSPSLVSMHPDPAPFAPTWAKVRALVDSILHGPGYIVVLLVFLAVRAAHVRYQADEKKRKSRISLDLQSWPLNLIATDADILALQLAKI